MNVDSEYWKETYGHDAIHVPRPVLDGIDVIESNFKHNLFKYIKMFGFRVFNTDFDRFLFSFVL